MKIFILFLFVFTAYQNQCAQNCNECGNVVMCSQCKEGYTTQLHTIANS
jgi:hypothetical protein